MPVAPSTIIRPGAAGQKASAASAVVLYRMAEGAVPFITRLFDAGVGVPADTQNSWLDVQYRTRTIVALWVDAGGTFSGAFEACYDFNGINWYPLTPEAGSKTTVNPITQASAPGFWIFSGPYALLRFNATAVGVAILHADAATVRL